MSASPTADHPPTETAPDPLSDVAAEAAGKLGEALEYVERARGQLYEFHHHIGHADLMLDEVLEGLEKGGHADLVALIRERVYGRDVLQGRWTYQVVDEFDDGYYAAWKDVTATVREKVPGGGRHEHEAALKRRRSPLSDPDLSAPPSPNRTT